METQRLKDINDHMALRGHKELGEFEFDNSFMEGITAINEEDFPRINGMKFYNIPKFVLKNRTKKFFKDNYKLHDIRFLPDVLLMYAINNINIKDEKELAKIFNESCLSINPFKLPLYFDTDNIELATITSQMIMSDDPEFDSKILPLLKPAYTKIRLCSTVNEITVPSYIHEITHSQIDHYKGITEEFYNSEVISIFHELYYSYNLKKKNLFYYELAEKLKHLTDSYNCIYLYKKEGRTDLLYEGKYNDYNYHTDIKYILSILKAFNMLALCIDDPDFNEYLIAQIQTIFDGKRTVEEMLYDIDVNFETSLNPEHIRKLVHLQ